MTAAARPLPIEAKRALRPSRSPSAAWPTRCRLIAAIAGVRMQLAKACSICATITGKSRRLDRQQQGGGDDADQCPARGGALVARRVHQGAGGNLADQRDDGAQGQDEADLAPGSICASSDRRRRTDRSRSAHRRRRSSADRGLADRAPEVCHRAACIIASGATASGAGAVRRSGRRHHDGCGLGESLYSGAALIWSGVRSSVIGCLGSPGAKCSALQRTAILRLPTPMKPPKSITAACGCPSWSNQHIDQAADLLAVRIRHRVAENRQRLLRRNVLHLAGRRRQAPPPVSSNAIQAMIVPRRRAACARLLRGSGRRRLAAIKRRRVGGSSSSVGSRAAATSRRLDRCQHDAAGDQGDADRMIDVERLAKEQHREDAAEHRHQVPGLSGARGADQFDAAVEEQIGDERREHRDVGQREPGRQAALRCGRPAAISHR